MKPPKTVLFIGCYEKFGKTNIVALFFNYLKKYKIGVKLQFLKNIKWQHI